MAEQRTPEAAVHLETIRIVLIEPRALVGLGIRGVLDGEPTCRSSPRSVRLTTRSRSPTAAPDVYVIDVELAGAVASAAPAG
jgi:hypothetical protein